MASPTDEELLGMMAAGELPIRIAERFGLAEVSDREAVMASMVRLHNGGAWDVLGLVERGELQALEGSTFFDACHFFCKLLPDIEDDVVRLAGAVEALVQRGGTDLASNGPNTALLTWCGKSPDRARRMMMAARQGAGAAVRNLTFALQALGEIKEAQEFLHTGDRLLQLSAVTTLGRLSDPDPLSRRRTLERFFELTRDADSFFKANLLYSTISIICRDDNEVGKFEHELIRHLTEQPNDEVMAVSARVIWAEGAHRRPDLFPVLLRSAGRTSTINQRTVKELDQALRSLLDGGQGNAAVDFLTELMLQPGDLALADFESFLSVLASGPPEILARATVRWLLTAESRLCDGLSQSLRPGVDDQPLEQIEDSVDGLSEVEHFLLCRKAIGWFFMKPVTAASILVGVLRICTPKVSADICQLLVSPLLANYGGLREYLSTIGPTDVAFSAVDAALKDNETYLSGMRAVPEIRELQPSESQRRVQRLKAADQSREIIRQAREKSVLLKFVKRSMLLYGRRSLSFTRDGGGGMQRFEMDLKSHGTSIEIPRMEILDPIGLDYTLRVFRVERLRQ